MLGNVWPEPNKSVCVGCQVLEPGDLLHLHGKDPLNPDKETYIITGDSGQGMTGGTIGGIVVADLLLGEDVGGVLGRVMMCFG